MKAAIAEEVMSISKVLWSGRTAAAMTFAGAVAIVITFFIITLLCIPLDDSRRNRVRLQNLFIKFINIFWAKVNIILLPGRILNFTR
jgi:hypothetical protein